MVGALLLILLFASDGLAQVQARRSMGAPDSERKGMPAIVATQPPERATETLADALSAAYRDNPAIQIRRYELRSNDEDYAQALSELRPTANVEVTGGYNETFPGRRTQSQRSLVDQLRSPNITNNNLDVQLTISQPLSTGGRAAADRDVAAAAIRAGREALRASEGDLFLAVLTAYVDIRRDTAALAIRKQNLEQLEATLGEVKARREAGELTRTDIAQTEIQLLAARAQFNGVEAQLEQDRASYAALVGHDPGQLAGEPALPQLPATIDEAFVRAGTHNPDLAQALMAERSSRAGIDAAAAEGTPRLSLQGTAGYGGQAAPFHFYNEDKSVTGRIVLTVPLTQGGLTASRIAQARDRNAADRLRVEAARRSVVQALVDAWNARVTARRNLDIGTLQLDRARTFYDGTFAEYRAGLRSTFDVLYAESTLIDTETAILGSRHDLYVAEATLLRRIGVLEARAILVGTGLYDPTIAFRHAERRNALPWDGAIRAFDMIGRPHSRQKTLEQPSRSRSVPAVAPAGPVADSSGLVRSSPNIPIGGTVGTPARITGP